MEAASQSETRRLLASLDVAFYTSLAALAAYLVLRWRPVAPGVFFICSTHFRCAARLAGQAAVSGRPTACCAEPPCATALRRTQLRPAPGRLHPSILPTFQCFPS
jgi:hypothetical protein